MQEVRVYDRENKPITRLVQWDKNIIIKIKDDEIKKSYPIHFFNDEVENAYVVESVYDTNETVLIAKIPNCMIEDSRPIYGYVYIDNGEEEKSSCGFKLYVKKRAKPSDYVHEETEDYISVATALRKCQECAETVMGATDIIDDCNEVVEKLDAYKDTVDFLKNNEDAISSLHDTVSKADEIISEVRLAAENGEFDGRDGNTPYIGENENWYIDGVDTGKPSRGKRGEMSEIAINSDGNWVVDGVDTGNSSKGRDGVSPVIEISESYTWLINGVDTGKSSKGDAGRSPDISIGANGNWFVDDVDTGRPSQVVNLDDDSNWADRIIALETAISDLQYESIKITSFRAEPTKFLYTNIDVKPDYLDARPVLYFSFSKTPKNATIDNYELTEHDIGKGRVTMALSSQTDHIYTLTAEDERGTRVSAKTSVKFCNYTYYGVSADENLTNLRVLTSVWEVAKTTFTVTANEGEYIWFALPARMGERNFKVGGFDGGFSLISTISFDNGNSFAPGIVGYVEDYYVYRSDNAGLGTTTVEVT